MEKISSLRLTALFSRNSCPPLTSRAEKMEDSADGNSVPSTSRSTARVSQIHDNQLSIFPWRQVVVLVERPLNFAIWYATVSWLCSPISNLVSNILQQLGFGPIRFTPYMVLFAIIMLRRVVKLMKARRLLEILHQRPTVPSHDQMVQTPPCFKICPTEDGVRLVEGWYGNLSGDITGDNARDVVNQAFRIRNPRNHSLSTGSTRSKAPDVSNQDLGTRKLKKNHLSAASTVHEAPDMINQDLGTRDLQSNGLSAGSTGDEALGVINQDLGTENLRRNGEGAPDIVPAMLSSTATESKSPVRIPWFKATRKSPAQSPLHDEVVVAIPNNVDVRVTRLAEAYDVNLPGSRVLHRRIEAGPQTGNFGTQFLPPQILESLRIAWTLDKDSTIQLGSYAVMKYTDAGLNYCILQEDWTPTISSFHRTSQSFLEFLRGECASWTVRGKNLQKAMLRLATTENFENVTILTQCETQNGIDVISFKEPRSLPMFLNKVYISASKFVEVEKGVTFKLHSQAKKVQPAFWTSVVDCLIPGTWTAIIMTSLSLWSRSILGTWWEVVVGCVAMIIPIITPTYYYLLLRNHVSPQGDDVSNLGPTHTLGESPNTSHATPQPPVKEDSCIQEEVTPLLNLACEEKSNQLQVLNEDKALNHVESLSNEDDLDLQGKTANDLWRPDSKGESFKLIALNESGVLASLVVSLSKHDNPIFQKNAIGALSSLATRGESAISQILNEEGALAGLVRALLEDDNPDLQAKAAGALLSLAIGGESMKWRIVNEEGALAGLVRSLSKDDNPELQKLAAKALGRLAHGSESIKWQILNKDGALSGLVNSLSKQDNPDLETNAAGALLSLGSGKESIKLKIMNEDGALIGLVRSLTRLENPGLAANAAGALWYLACGGELMKFQILNEDETLTGLVRGLCQNNNPNLEANAAGALWYLAYGGESMKLQILNENGGVTSLVRSLCNHDNPTLEANVAGALWTLADGGEPMKLRITNEEGALTSLVRALSRDDNPNLQARAAGALLSLATGRDSIKLQIVNAQGALEGLVKSLSNHDNPKLQANAAGALWSLALGVESIQLKIINQGGALANLVRSLSNEGNLDLQARARGALKALAIRGN